nr:site-specific integrase [uncultured Cohaesibacter sp.]
MEAVPGYPNLHRREGTYYLYKRVPQGLLEAFDNRKFIRKSLRTKDLSEAKVKLHQELVALDEEFAQAKADLKETLSPSEAKTIVEGRLKDMLVEDMQIRDEGDRASQQAYGEMWASFNETQLEQRDLSEKQAEGTDKADQEFKPIAPTFPLSASFSEFGLSRRDLFKSHETVSCLKPHYRDALARQDLSAAEEDIEELAEEHHLRLHRGSEGWRNLAREVLAMWVRYIDVLERRNNGEPDEFDLSPPSITEGETSALKSTPVGHSASKGGAITLEKLVQLYIEDPARSASDRTNKGYDVVYRTLKDVMGAGRDVSTINREDCKKVRDALQKTPVNALQRFPGKDTFEVIKLAEETGAKLLSPPTINNRLRNMSALFKWAVREDYMVKNYAEGLGVNDPVKARDKRRPFTEEELQIIFSAPLYSGCQSEFKYHLPGSQIIKKGRYWVPLLSLWTGMRLGECCQLHCDDIKQIDGVWCIIIQETKDGEGLDEADKKRVKTSSGERFVPIHSALERLGFINFALQQKQAKHVRLFPELKPSADGYLSNNFSKWFNDKSRFLGKLGLAGNGASFHSFRHNYRDAMRQAELNHDVVLALGGWSSGDTSDQYGGSLNSSFLKEQIERIAYAGLKLPLHN